MYTVLLWLCLLFVGINICGGAGGLDARIEELSRVGKYELVKFEIDSRSSSETILSFHGFGHDYKLLLTLNDKMVPSKMTHTHGIPNTGSRVGGYISSMSESCHYHISNKDMQGGLSLCAKRGVRGRIIGFNDTLIIRPSKYYLDLKHDSSEDLFHEISDSHLIYLMSDFNSSGVPYPDGVSLSSSSIARKKSSSSSMDHSRKLTGAYNSGDNKIEMYILCDAVMYEYYVATYSSNWYDELLGYFEDIMNDVSDVYEDTDWGDSIGDVSVHFSELEVATDWNGNYATLYPDIDSSSSCSDISNTECTIDGSGYLGKWVTYLANYKDTSTFDNAQLWSAMNFQSAAGWGYVGTVCPSGNSYSSANIAALYGYNWAVRSSAHELGHNLGMSHDQDTTCGIEAGLMGYGSGEGFSDCSIDALNSEFSNNGGCGSLDDSADDFFSNIDSSDTGTDDTTDDDEDEDEDDMYTCSDGCEIYSSYYDDNYCDCLDCGDEPSWTCTSCASSGCATSCGGYAFCDEGTGTSNDDSSSGDDSGTTDDGDYYICSDGCEIYSSYYDDDYCDCPDCGDEPSWSCSTCDCADCGGYGYCGSSSFTAGESDCNGYSYVYYYSMALGSGINDFNGWWYGSGGSDCYNNEVYYSKEIDGTTWYTFISDSTGYWHIMNSMSSASAKTSYAYCMESNILYCGGSWYVLSGTSGEYVLDDDVIVSTYSGMNERSDDDDTQVISDDGTYVDGSSTSTDSSDVTEPSVNFNNNCTNNFGESVCIYNSGDLWNGVASFTYNGCKDDMPFFYYRNIAGRNGNDSSYMYYLHYEGGDDDAWLISYKTLYDAAGLAHCQETELTDCTYNEWYVLDTSINDEMEYILDESMGYDSDCVSIENEDTSNSLYCDLDGTCALWSVELNIQLGESSSGSSVDLCNDLEVGCISESLTTDYSDANSVSLICLSDSDINVMMNITFSSKLGESIYNEFLNDYSTIVNKCDLSDEISVTLVTSNLNVCDNCNGFGSSSSTSGDEDNDEEKTSLANGMNSHWIVNIALSLGVVYICLTF